MTPAAKMMIGNGTSKKKIAMKAAAAKLTMMLFFSDALADPHHGFKHDREHRRLEAEEQRLDRADFAKGGINPAQRP